MKAFDETEMRTRQKQRNVTPGEPKVVKQHHRNPGAKGNHRFEPQITKQQTRLSPTPTNLKYI